MSDYRDSIYEDYESGPQPSNISDLRPRAPYLRKLVREHFPREKTATVLDIGCGYGALLHFAKEAGYTNVFGMDRSPSQVRTAVKLGIEGVRQVDWSDGLASVPLGSTDAVVALDVVEHFRKDELVPLLGRIFRVLRHGGRLIVHTVNGESPMAGSTFFGDITHETCFTRVSLAQLLRSTGFEDIRSYEDAPIPHGLVSTARWGLWLGIRSVLRFATAAETGDIGRKAILTRNFLTVAIKH